MTRRECVYQSLRHETPAALPYFLEMTDEVARRMRKETGDALFFEHSGSFLAMERNETFKDLGHGQFEDHFGVVWDKGVQEGDFGIVARAPLAHMALSEYTFPEPNERHIRQSCEKLAAQKDVFTVFNIGFSLFERAWTLRGMENLLCDMLEDEAYTKALFESIVQFNLKVIDIAAQYPVDCIFFGDDWGQQKGLIMGKPLWDKYIKPCLAREYAAVKSHGKFVAQHSCGDCVSLFPDLVELGLDIYNTFQPEVYDIEMCKREFGNRLTFFGGISTQRLLPFKSPEEVKREMERIISVLSPGGGFILAPTHAMPGDIPSENVLAFLEVARKYGAVGEG